MRRLFLVVLTLLVLVSSIIGCEPAPAQTPTPSPAPTPAPDTTPSPPPSPAPPTAPATTPTPAPTTQPTPAPAPSPTPAPAPAPRPAAKELTVHFIDVGQGDSILIDWGESEILIDGGDKSPGVVSYLSHYVEGTLEVLVANHPHADHIGGLIDVLARFEIKEIWLNGDTSTSQTYSQFMSAVNSEGAQVYEARRGDTIEVDELILNVLHPVHLDDTVNNNSIVLSLSYGEIDFLFMGDAEKEAETSMLESGIVPNVEILKVGHHGSSSSSSAEFLDAVKPQLAIYMAGEGNSYGHPHEETITALIEIKALVYGTDEYGTIIITTDGLVISSPVHHSALPEAVKPPEKEQVIEDLAYIKIMTGEYSDDADPEPEGISLRITFYNSKSEPINFQNIPVPVTIKLYSDKNQELVYEEQVTIYRADLIGVSPEIHIPFEKILLDQNNYDKIRNIEVTVTTPEQGDFQATSSLLLPRVEKIEQEEELFLEIVSVTSPIGKGCAATLQAKTAPGAHCTISVYYKSGPSKASGLYPKEADSEGNVSWSWKVGTRTTPGSWQIVVTASVDGKTTSQTTYFTVY